VALARRGKKKKKTSLAKVDREGADLPEKNEEGCECPTKKRKARTAKRKKIAGHAAVEFG